MLFYGDNAYIMSNVLPTGFTSPFHYVSVSSLFVIRIPRSIPLCIYISHSNLTIFRRYVTILVYKTPVSDSTDLNMAGWYVLFSERMDHHLRVL